MAKTNDQNKKLLKMIADEREKVAGYEQVAKLYTAYITVLLRKLGATKENPVEITKPEISEAMNAETRVIPTGEGWNFYTEG